MLRKNLNMKPAIRYSPKPMSEYTLWNPTALDRSGAGIGPDIVKNLLIAGGTPFWNLIYLSHPFESCMPPAGNMIYSWCLDFIKTNIHTGKTVKYLDDANEAPENHLLHKLEQPAPQFIKWLDDNPQVIQNSAIYATYGDRWLNLMRKRAFKCATYDEPDEPKIRSVAEARKLLQAFKMPTR